ncbi:defective in Cullin neddylation protein 1 [Fomitopsis serialis]|uniref:defective in Cullin neddylation protein 1 n=1 Tax=Fomitopsis serialis TaxID=139415 RepID=UPI002007DD36|nr:defective in Cullin neddylation protein 1 [Neoantrodia serialis]KAH9922224.1 defective in Cullin neddylation protein 1 [Neoantrodia serialis]
MAANVDQFVAITGAPTRDAKRFLEKYKRLDVAIDAFYGDPNALASAQRSTVSTTKINQLFDQYKDPDGDDMIAVDGTIRLCGDLGSDPADVVWLAVAYDLKSPSMGEWARKGWVDGLKRLNCDSISGMQSLLTQLRQKLSQDPEYFTQVYNYTFEFSRPQGQRSLGLEDAQGFWALLIPHGLQGGALAHVQRDDDVDMTGEEGWKEEHTQWWFEFLNEKGGKGISKDTWQMFLEFVRSIDSKFEKYDAEAAWPSTIDDFVEYAKQRVSS